MGGFVSISNTFARRFLIYTILSPGASFPAFRYSLYTIICTTKNKLLLDAILFEKNLEGNICGKTFAVEPNPRKPRKFSPSNILSYTVYDECSIRV